MLSPVAAILIMAALWLLFKSLCRKMLNSERVKRVSCPPSGMHDDDLDGITVIEQTATQRDYECGHTGPVHYRLQVYGRKTRTFKDSRTCPGCMIRSLEKEVVRCARCGTTIFSGEEVTIRHLNDFEEIPRYAKEQCEDWYICCSHVGCWDQHTETSGIWNGSRCRIYQSREVEPRDLTKA